MKDIKRKYSFSDIEFKPYFTEEEVNFIKKMKLMKDVDKYMQGVVEFENGYGVSVLLGQLFHSDGKDTYRDDSLKFFGFPIVVDSFDKGDYLVYNFDKYHTYIVSPGRGNIYLFGSFYERRKATYEEREKIFERLRESLIF